MCGIAGVFHKTGEPADLRMVRAMIHRAQHRGPDGSACSVSGNVALGHCRLAIIDLSQASGQPMHSSDGQLTIVFNGEIYNYIEIRRMLQDAGYQFRTQSDTEVILAAYAEWGPGCVDRFNGMWALAIHDRKRKQLFCSRDRFGVKPFYYVNTGRLFAFASEIKQLLDCLPQRRANREVLLTFLTCGYHDCSASTFFDGVAALPAGHNMAVDLNTGAIELSRYYRLCALDLHDARLEEAEEKFRETFENAVALRMRSDVPVGTCLSGGLDSSAIATTAAHYGHRNGHPFCAVTGVSVDPENDESEHARKIVERNGLRWLTVRPTYKDFAKALDGVFYHQDEPFDSASPVMQYFVMRTARENGIPVLLDGQGADECLMGYAIDFGMYVANMLHTQGLRPGMRAIRESVRVNPKLSVFAMLRYAIGLRSAPLRFTRFKRRTRYLLEFPVLPEVLRETSAAIGDLVEFQKHEISSAILPKLLRMEDRNSMAFGVETRLPFLDYRMVELGLGLSTAFKLHDGWSKWILRYAMRHRMPCEIAWRRDKIGFGVPERFWQEPHNERMWKEILQSELVRQVCDPGKLKAVRPHLDNCREWRLFAVSRWSSLFQVSELN